MKIEFDPGLDSKLRKLIFLFAVCVVGIWLCLRFMPDNSCSTEPNAPVIMLFSTMVLLSIAAVIFAIMIVAGWLEPEWQRERTCPKCNHVAPPPRSYS